MLEDILEALKPFSESMGVTFLVDEESAEVGGIPVIKSKASISDGKDKITATCNCRGRHGAKGYANATAFWVCVILR